MNYPGGKGSCFRHLVNLMPPHDVYIESHLGGGNVLLRKKPARRNIGIDIDPEVVRAFSSTSYSGFPAVVEMSDSLFAAGPTFEFYCGDAAGFLTDFAALPAYADPARVLVYADPPYLHSTRRDTKLYRYEYTDAQHRELLDVLASLPFCVILSCYTSALYTGALQHRRGWRYVEFPNTTRRGRVMEGAWLNFDKPAVLHDPTYAGYDFRERERIKRKRERWTKRLAAMSAHERQVIAEALERTRRELASPAGRDPIAAGGDADRIAVAGDGIVSRCLASEPIFFPPDHPLFASAPPKSES